MSYSEREARGAEVQRAIFGGFLGAFAGAFIVRVAFFALLVAVKGPIYTPDGEAGLYDLMVVPAGFLAGMVLGALLPVWALRLEDDPEHPLVELIDRWSPFRGWWARRLILDLAAVLLFAAATLQHGALLATSVILNLN
jgi:hypothetical protein